MWSAQPHQERISEEALTIMLIYNMVYLAMQERTGKTITSILIAEKMPSVKSVLVITTKKALEGWGETLSKFKHSKIFEVTNYHSAAKVKGSHDLIILDEPHKYVSGYPNKGVIWKQVYVLCKGKPIIYLSATPYAQGPQLLYHQFALSSFSPWRQLHNFYEWFREYALRDKDGTLPVKRISATQTVVDYEKVKVSAILEPIKHLFISYTRSELGFEHEPEDVLHYIELSPNVKDVYNKIAKDKGLAFVHAETGNNYVLACDTPAKLRYALHMLEGGVLKINEEYVTLGNREKIDYILQEWGDSEDLAIMYYFKADLPKLNSVFKKAGLFQATSYAEGVDLSHYRHLVIYSQNHSTAQHTQRRARQANINRTEEIKVHYILVKGAVSDKAYKAVSINKRDFVDTIFERI